MDIVQEMRTSSDLCREDQRTWRDAIGGSSTGNGGIGPTGASEHLPAPGNEREDLPRQDHGNERQAAGDLPRTRKSVDGDSSRPTSRTRVVGNELSGLCNDDGTYYTDAKDTSARDTTDDKKRVAEPKCGNIYACDKGPKGQAESQITGSPGDSDDSGLRRGGCAGDPHQRRGAGGIAGLWTSLMSLQERMKPCEKGEVSMSEAYGIEKQECHQSISTSIESTTCNFHNTSTTSTTNDTTKDILSMKNSFAREIFPSLARRVARAAALTAVVMNPVMETIAAVEGRLDLVEVACSPTSTLTATFEKEGYQCLRVNHLTGYDLDTKKGTTKLADTLSRSKPKMTWVSLPCTRLSSLQNLTPRDEEAMTRFLRRRGQDLRRADEVAQGLGPILETDDADFGWEWPAGATAGWQSSAIQRLERMAKKKKKKRPLYRIRVDGCAYGLCWKDKYLRKGWQILTTSREMYLMVNKRCDGTHEHAECRGEAAQASAYYPPKLCADVLKSLKVQWKTQDKEMIYLTEKHLLDVEPEHQINYANAMDYPTEKVMALTRHKMDLSEAPTGRRLEAIRQMMMRVHRASGHAGFSNLQRLLEARGSPKWAVELAGTLECPECKEAAKPYLKPPASVGDEPHLFEVLGSDVFEYEDPKTKKKYDGIIWRDRASGLTMFDILHEGEEGGGGRWAPKTQDIIKSFSKWIMYHPAPTWVVTDAATYYTSWEFTEFLGKSGIGFTVVPAEAHYLLGAEEQAIGVAKRTVDKMRREERDLDVQTIFQLTAHAMNSHVGASGFSAYQWIHGKDHFAEELPLGVQPSKAFGGLLKAREKIKVIYEREKANDKLSKLNNAVGRPTMKVHAGQLVMLWRMRMKPGKTGGSWIGPLRVILVEGSTIWLASGATLVRAKLNQLRAVTKREELTATLEGTAIYKTPVSAETLLRAFQGRHYLDVSGNTPSEAQIQQDLSQTEVQVQPKPDGPRADSWLVREQGGVKTLVRIHNLPRLSLYVPTKLSNCPISYDELTGKRTTLVRPLHGGDEVQIEDEMTTQRTLQDRWIGETWFEVKQGPRPLKIRRSVPKGGQKRKAEEELQAEAADQDDELQPDQELPAVPEQEPPEVPDQELPEAPGQAIPPSSLNEALVRHGLEGVDGLPVQIQGNSGANECPVPGCQLPGGHHGVHEGPEGKFLYDTYSGKKMVTEEPEELEPAASSSSSSSSSEELVPDDREEALLAEVHQEDQETFFAMEIDVSEEDFAWLAKNCNRRKANVWLSKKMSEKGKEIVWNELPLEKKKEFDLAQAKELAQVATPRALRNLTQSELATLDPKKVMNMRWVLTTKQSGQAKARLVVLGFQAHNLTEVETSSPTMSKAGRNILLTVAAALKLTLKSGDVTSAFLQTMESLEHQELTVWAPPELATFFGAEPHDRRALRVLRAFYGLVHAPRKWYESVCAVLKASGWHQLHGDRCLYVLKSKKDGSILGLAGVHVDDFLMAGNEQSEEYIRAEKELTEAFRFGKWEKGSDGFEFAGCHVAQQSDGSIYLHQKLYTEQWVEEIPTEPGRSPKSALTKQDLSNLRGALGTASWRANQSSPQYQAASRDISTSQRDQQRFL